jgi:hypothetical protein
LRHQCAAIDCTSTRLQRLCLPRGGRAPCQPHPTASSVRAVSGTTTPPLPPAAPAAHTRVHLHTRTYIRNDDIINTHPKRAHRPRDVLSRWHRGSHNSADFNTVIVTLTVQWSPAPLAYVHVVAAAPRLALHPAPPGLPDTAAAGWRSAGRPFAH